MDRKSWGETENGDAFLKDPKKQQASKSSHRYTKEELLAFKEHPLSKQRPSCLSENYDRDGIWDPQKWHASFSPASGRSSPVESLMKDLDIDLSSLVSKITVDPREKGRAECSGGVAEEEDVLEIILAQKPAADQEMPWETILPEQSQGEFDFNEFFNLDKVPGLTPLTEDVLGEGSVSASRFTRWFSNPSRSASRSSNLGSTPHEELERLAGLEQAKLSPGQNLGNSFAPIPLEDHAENKVDILEMIQKAKMDLKSLLSSLSANKEKLKVSSHTGVVPSVKEVEAGIKGLKVGQQMKNSTPFVTDQLEETLSVVTSNRELKKDGDMTAFNKLVNTMKASGTLPSQSKISQNLESHLMSPDEIPGQSVPKNILQELPGPPVQRPASFNLLSGFMGSLEPTSSLLGQRAPSPPLSQVFQTQAAADFLCPFIPSPGYTPGPQQLLGDPFQGICKSMGPVTVQQMSQLELQQPALEGFALPHDLTVPAPNFYQPGFGKPQVDRARDRFRNRQQRVTKSPAPVLRRSSSSPASSASITSMLSPSFTPTSMIHKMYESKEKSKEELVSGKTTLGDYKEDSQKTSEETLLLVNSLPSADRDSSTINPKLSTLQRPSCSIPLSQNNYYTKEQDYRPKATGRKAPTLASPVPGKPFFCPIHQVPRVPHVPIVGPAHQLHPRLAQRMVAQRRHPQHLTNLLQTGVLPPGMDLTHLQGLSDPMLGQPFYPLPTASHPIPNPRPGTPLHWAMMQQQLQNSVLYPPGSGSQSAAVNFQTTPQNVLSQSGLPHFHSQLDHRPSQRSSSSVGLAKWFGSDVLQQPLPSMPAKVINVDELEYQQ
ncbi:eukaryotic translation initiation factor 4E transporter-like isoform X2 [Suncus etruscus]|uniref:eukaryotic translation initiation factor 4E transporter-like isoform X2 n=1 Tax=Suncus etruscus TaxID=109475 RepID=UPI00210FB94E|nr:eukaryotic translation initiation factor 4E transporter-like isoform X2 [Suncus etruscus]